MYIALEGVKGSGKSTLFNALTNYLNKNDIKYRTACPTAQISNNNIIELFFKKFSSLRNFDGINELLYAFRSNYTALKILNYNGLIIGDRSIITTYAYRWNKFTDKTRFMKRVNLLEPLIPTPDYVIYLDVKAEKAVERINKRPKRNYGLKDEKYDNIKEVLDVYKQLIVYPIERIKNVHWHIIDANNDFDYVFNESIKFIYKVINLNFEKVKYEY